MISFTRPRESAQDNLLAQLRGAFLFPELSKQYCIFVFVIPAEAGIQYKNV